MVVFSDICHLCLKTLHFSRKGFEQSLGGLPTYFHTAPTPPSSMWWLLWGGKWKWVKAMQEGTDLGLCDQLRTTATDRDSDVQITDFYWTLWGIQLFVGK